MHRYLDPDDIDKPSPLFDQLKWLEMAGLLRLMCIGCLQVTLFSAPESHQIEKNPKNLHSHPQQPTPNNPQLNRSWPGVTHLPFYPQT